MPYRATRYGAGMSAETVAPMSLADVVVANVRAEIARRRWTQSQAAVRLGLSQQALSDRLTGRSRVSIDELGRIADALRLDPADLLARPKGLEPPTFWLGVRVPSNLVSLATYRARREARKSRDLAEHLVDQVLVESLRRPS